MVPISLERSLNIYSVPMVDLCNAKPTTRFCSRVRPLLQRVPPLLRRAAARWHRRPSDFLVSFAEIIDAVVSGAQNEWWCGSKVLLNARSQIAALWSKSCDVQKGTFDSHSLDCAIVNVTVDFESDTFDLSNPLASNVQREKLKPPLPILLHQPPHC
jgi:hypothetical protein